MQRDSVFRFALLLSFYIFSLPLAAQDQSDQNWLFGNTANWIQFSRPGDTARLVIRPVAGIATYGNGGGAVASHPSSGGLLFYSDGATVYDATHRAMPNGTGLGGNSSGNQPAVIVQIPGQTDRYYVITNSATALASGTIRFSEVDMTLLGNNTVNPNFPAPPLGDVAAVKAVGVANLDNEAEAMIIIPHANGTDYWLITQEGGTGGFNISTITAAGITGAATPVDPGTGLTFRASHFAYHAPTGQLAVAPADENKNVMIFNFNNTSGSITFDAATGFVFNSAVTGVTTPPAIYDMAWNSAANYLYISRRGDAGIQGDLLQFDRVNSTVTPVTVLTQPVERSYGLQMAPDSSIYHLYQATATGPFLVGRITDPDTVAVEVNYEPRPFGNANFNAMQFPSFAPINLTLTVDFTFSGTCANSPTTFFPIVDPGADSLVWSFGDGTSSNIWAPSHTYTQGQAYPVTVIAYAGGDSAMITKTVMITQFDVQLQLVSDTTACSCELNFPNANPAPPPCNPFTVTATATGQPGAIQWFGPPGALAGQTTLTLTSVDSAGFYYVIVQDPNGTGCAAYAGVNIKEYGIDDPRSNIWYFGNNGGINFNGDFIPSTGADPIVGDLISAEGTAVICDRNGQVVVSTNGEQVFDRDGNLLALGMGGSQNATQSALIMPVPGDPTLYYIFVTQQVYPPVAPGYELRYAIFDLKMPPLGQLIDPDGDPSNGAGTVLFTKSTERMTGNLNWLIAHEYGNNNFRAYRITPQGIEGPIISSIGSDHSLAVAENAEGYMKLSPNSILAVALSNPGISNVVEIFDFVDSSGAVVNFRSVDLQQPAGQVYGIEFSPGGQKLFATTIGSPSVLHEFAYDSTSNTYIKKPAIPVQTPSGEIGAIQFGPDGNIYVATNGSNALGTIAANENPDQPSFYTENAFPLAGGTSSTLGLPNFIQNIMDPTQTPSISVAGVCFGSPTTFIGNGTDQIDTLTWYFGDGASQEGIGLDSVTHTYGAPGTYIVTLELSNRCAGLLSPALVDTVVISPIPNVQSGVVSLCNGGDDERMVAILDSEATPDLIYGWSHGDSTRNPIPPIDGDYTVTVTSGAGCSATGEWEVFDNRPQVELGPDQTVCENSPNITLDAGNPGTQYDWRLNGTTISTAQTITIATTPPTAGDEYLLIISDTFTNCVIRDSVTLTINEDAEFTTTSVDPSTCNAFDGSISITIAANGIFSYFVNGGTTPTMVTASDQTGPGGPYTAPNLGAGTYTVLVSNQITGCANQSTVSLSDGAYTVAIDRATTCNDANGLMQVQITTTPDQTPFDYRLINSSNVVATSGTGASNGVLTAGVPNDTYTAEVTKLTCVAVSPPVAIAQDPPVPIDNFTIDNCAPSITVTASGANTFLWDGTTAQADSFIQGQETSSSISPAAPVGTSGQFTYNLHLEPPVGAAACPSDTPFTININIDPPASVSQSDPCTDAVTLSATPAGTYTYVWFRNGTQMAGAQQIQIAATDNGSTYRFQARNTTTGCIITSTDLIAVVVGELTVDISNDQPCEGTDFDLTATPNQAPDSYAWSFNNNVIPGANAAVLTVTDDGEGIYKVTVARNYPGGVCTADDEVQITVADVVEGLMPAQAIICPEDANTDPATREIVLRPGADYLGYNWFKDGVELGITTDTLTVDEAGVYSVDLVNRNSCPGSDQTTVLEQCDPKITGPNAFRPGGLNSEFFLYTFFIADTPFDIFIFNRWGEMVFHSSDVNFRWNGGYNNEASQGLPPGTYSYVVKYKSLHKQGVQEHRGGVVLLR